MDKKMLSISKGLYKENELENKTIIITGGGGGIGYETARSLVWLGANVVIAEKDIVKGKEAQGRINHEFNTNRAHFLSSDIRKKRDIRRLERYVNQRFGSVDVILNNATIAPIGEVHCVDIRNWDDSYKVNLRATVLLVQTFMPSMLQRDTGTIAFYSSSGAAPYMGAYEIFKVAQVELCNTLSMELEGTNIITYTIGPGLIKTDTAHKAIVEISKSMGISVDEFYKMNEHHMLDAESAGAGVAASVVNAKIYRGKEISSIQALMDAQIAQKVVNESSDITLDDATCKLVTHIYHTYLEQYKGWMDRNIFERQWILRDFKKETGMSVDEMKESLLDLKTQTNKSHTIKDKGFCVLEKLRDYYIHQRELLKGYERNEEKLRENTEILNGWISDVSALTDLK